MLRVIVVDDEPDAIQAISLIINEYCDFAEVIGKALNIVDARELIIKTKPDLVILDIEMPRGNGFELLESIPNRNFAVIFVTAYNNYAIKAFKYSAIDYVLKPIDIDDFLTAIKKVNISDNDWQTVSNNKIDLLLDNIKLPTLQKIVISGVDGVEFINVSDIMRIEANGSYSMVFTTDKKSHIASKSLKDFNDILEQKKFFRIHHSHLINLSFVKKYWFSEGGYIELTDNTTVPMSRRKKEEFMQAMQIYTGDLKNRE